MVRPRRCRYVWSEAKCNYFKPKGIGLREIEEINLKIEELEAVRFVDLENMEQIIASEKMNVSQPTFSRILNEARRKIADAIVNGKAIKIEGGNYKMPNKDGTGPLGKGPKTGRGMGKCLGRTSDMLMPLRQGGGPYGRGRRFQRIKENIEQQNNETNKN